MQLRMQFPDVCFGGGPHADREPSLAADMEHVFPVLELQFSQVRTLHALAHAALALVTRLSPILDLLQCWGLELDCGATSLICQQESFNTRNLAYWRAVVRKWSIHLRAA